VAHPIGRSLPSFYNESFRPSGLVQGSPENGSAAGLIMAAPPQREARRAEALICPDDGQRRALVSAGVDQDDNAEVLGAKAGLLVGPTLEDY
jgi:hypothetical protein